MGPLGILGGGQLGRMTLQAASVLGLDVVVAERFADSPAARLTRHEVVFPNGWDDRHALEDLARRAPVITLESEFIDAGILTRLEALGARVLPSPACVAVVQDKLTQKRALAAAGLPVPAFEPVDHPEDLAALAARLGWPLMLKARRDGYDGRGNLLVDNPSEAAAACERLGWPGRHLYAEAVVAFERELAVIVIRGQDGSIVRYPVVETRQDASLHICREVHAPAPLPAHVAGEAGALAQAAVEAVGGVGAFGVEFFLSAGGRVSINELAPRPHNSGHYTIDACQTSQFANHVRAVCGLPLGDPTPFGPAAMVNLLGSGGGCPTDADLQRALGVPRTTINWYAKHENRPGRKLGHVTSLGASLDEAVCRAREAAAGLPL